MIGKKSDAARLEPGYTLNNDPQLEKAGHMKLHLVTTDVGLYTIFGMTQIDSSKYGSDKTNLFQYKAHICSK